MIVAVVRAWTTPPASNVSATSAMATVATVTGIASAGSAGCRLRATGTGRQGEADDHGDAGRWMMVQRHVCHRLPSARWSAAVAVSTATCAATCCASACATASADRSSDVTSVSPASYRSRMMRRLSRACATASRPTASLARAASSFATAMCTSSRAAVSVLVAFECASRGLVARLGEPRLVGKSVEHVHACDRPDDPARGAAVPGAAVEFPATLRRHLREERRAGRRLARAGELLLECRERHIGPVLERLGFERREIGGIDVTAAGADSSRNTSPSGSPIT